MKIKSYLPITNSISYVISTLGSSNTSVVAIVCTVHHISCSMCFSSPALCCLNIDCKGTVKTTEAFLSGRNYYTNQKTLTTCV